MNDKKKKKRLSLEIRKKLKKRKVFQKKNKKKVNNVSTFR